MLNLNLVKFYKKLVVVKLKVGNVSGYTWDLDVLSKENDWLLQKGYIDNLRLKLDDLNTQIFEEFSAAQHGSVRQVFRNSKV